MGNNSQCCACDNEDMIAELRKDASIEKYVGKNITPSVHRKEQIIFSLKKTPYEEYSILLFQRFNSLRIEPWTFYSESTKYGFTDLIQEIIDKKNKSLRLTWSTRKQRIISKIMNDSKINNIYDKIAQIKQDFSKDFDVKVYLAKSYYNKTDEGIWDLLKYIRKFGELELKNVVHNKIDYCIVFSLSDENFRKLDNSTINSDGITLSCFDDDKTEEINKIDELNNVKTKENVPEKIISFFFILNYLDKKTKSRKGIIN